MFLSLMTTDKPPESYSPQRKKGLPFAGVALVMILIVVGSFWVFTEDSLPRLYQISELSNGTSSRLIPMAINSKGQILGKNFFFDPKEGFAPFQDGLHIPGQLGAIYEEAYRETISALEVNSADLSEIAELFRLEYNQLVNETVGDSTGLWESFHVYTPKNDVREVIENEIRKSEDITFFSVSGYNEQGQAVGKFKLMVDRDSISWKLKVKWTAVQQRLPQFVAKFLPSWDGNFWNTTAFYWDGDNFFDLNRMVPEMGEWVTLLEASDINDRGVIVGRGRKRDGEIRGFILTPIEDAP